MGFQEQIDSEIKNKVLYFIGDRLPADWYEAFRMWLPLAEAGDPKAQFNIGRCYILGNGIEKDQALGMMWLEKAAAQGEARSHFNLYLEYAEMGAGEKANLMLDKALELQEPRALRYLIEQELEVAKKELSGGNREGARLIYKKHAGNTFPEAELGLCACDLDISYSKGKEKHYYSYIASVSSVGGSISGGGSRTGSYNNPAVVFRATNKGVRPVRASIWIDRYSGKNQKHKLGDARRLDFPWLNPGESATVQEEIFDKKSTVVWSGYTIRHDDRSCLHIGHIKRTVVYSGPTKRFALGLIFLFLFASVAAIMAVSA